jgi:cytochrome c-type biogenesis protein
VEAFGNEISFGIAGLAIAVLAGLLSFLSPCVLPLVPSYLAFVTGVGGAAPDNQLARRGLAFRHACAFVAGFSLVFILLGASATALGQALNDDRLWLSRIGGALLILFGLTLVGALRWAPLQRDLRVLPQAVAGHRAGYIGSGVIGAAFGAGWSPCIGPVLGGILTLAATSSDVGGGVALLTAYSLGLAIPFLLAAIAAERFARLRGRAGNWLAWTNRISGALLIALGILMVTGDMQRITSRLAQAAPGWMG